MAVSRQMWLCKYYEYVIILLQVKLILQVTEQLKVFDSLKISFAGSEQI